MRPGGASPSLQGTTIRGAHRACSGGRVAIGSDHGVSAAASKGTSGELSREALTLPRIAVSREWTGRVILIVVMTLVMTIVAMSLLQKAQECSDRGGDLQVSPRATWLMCALPNGEQIPM